MNRNIKFSELEIKKILNQYNLVQIEEYVNNREKFKCKNADRYLIDIRLDNLLYGYKPVIWGRNNINNIEYNVKLFLQNKKINAKFINYEIAHSKGRTDILIYLQCSCGNIFKKKLTKLINNCAKNIECNECMRRHKISGVKRSNKEYIKEFNSYGYNVIDKNIEKISPYTKVLVKDKFGFLGNVSLYACRNHKHFATFDVRSNRENFVYNANLFLEQNGIDTTCIDFVDKNKLLFVCGCGEKMVLTQKQFRGNKLRCDKCTKRFSSLEIKLKNFFIDHNIKFKEQWRYADCIDKLPLPFDFYLPDFNTLIEADGKQHFELRFGQEEDFQIRKKHDKIKDEYCKLNNIDLIRIPYYDFENDNYKNYLLKFIKE